MKQKALYESNDKINNIYSVLDALLSSSPYLFAGLFALFSLRS